MKNFLKALRQSTREPFLKEESVSEIEDFFDYLKNYWRLYDIDNGTIHEKIFETLYIKNRKNCYDKISAFFFIGERTLNRYVLRYNLFAWKVIKTKYPKNSEIFKISSEIIKKTNKKSTKDNVDLNENYGYKTKKFGIYKK